MKDKIKKFVEDHKVVLTKVGVVVGVATTGLLYTRHKVNSQSPVMVHVAYDKNDNVMGTFVTLKNGERLPFFRNPDEK